MKKTLRKILLAVIALATIGGFSSCGDDDEEENTTVTQSEIEKYLIGHDWNTVWVGDLNAATQIMMYFADIIDEYSGKNGNYHLTRKADDYVIDHREFMFSVKDNKINIEVDLSDDHDDSKIQTFTLTVLSIDAKTMKAKGLLPTMDKETTFIMHRNTYK